MELNIFEKNAEKVCCFIHSTNIHYTETEILENIINVLNNYNFFDVVDFVYINNIGIPICETKFQSVSKKIIICNYSNDTNLFENCTLKIIYSFSLINPEYKVLYLHTKGVSYEKISPFYSNILDWVNFMLYCLTSNSKLCIELLDNNDCVGSNYRGDWNGNPQHFSGNFWWANANYINTLSITNLNDKYDAEWWLFKNNPKFINIHTSTIMGHYQNSYKLDEYESIVKNSFEYYKNNKNYSGCSIIHLDLGERGNGLCNQLFKIVNCLFYIIQNKKFNKTKIIIVINSFNKNALNPIYCSIDEILDIESINEYLKKFNIILIAKDKAKLEILKVEYGRIGVNLVDITEKIKEHHLKNNHFHINTYNSIELNPICGDPVPLVKKFVYFTYKINDECFSLVSEEFGSKVLNAIEIDLENKDNKLTCNYLNTISIESKKNLPLFNELLCELKFAKFFYNKTENLKFKIFNEKNFKKCSIIHLRNEEDAIPFWGSINNMDENSFKCTLNNKYKSLIDKYLKPSEEEIIIVLSSEINNNPVIEHMKLCGLNYIFFEKNNNERESDAIVDLLISKSCNNVYIGNYNPNTLAGSTFGYFISNIIEQNVTKVLLDLDNINCDEFIIKQ